MTALDLYSASGLDQVLRLVTTIDVVVQTDDRGQREDAGLGAARLAP